MHSCLNLVRSIISQLLQIICIKLKILSLSDQPLPSLRFSFCVCLWTGAVNAPWARLLPLRLGPAELPSGSCWLWHWALSAGQKPGHIRGDAHLPLIIPPHPLCLSQYVGLDVSWLCILKGHYSPVFGRVWVNSFMIMHVEWERGLETARD